ncbi:MAG: recombination protein RecO, partial [Epsilonproteobacteria bacterium]|nr:recombination protein RecO [Campylobacterota bacterium]
EGRLHKENICFLCSLKIKDEDISLIRAYLPTHKQCSHTMAINRNALNELFINKSSIFLNDKEVDRLWYVLLQGL